MSPFISLASDLELEDTQASRHLGIDMGPPWAHLPHNLLDPIFPPRSTDPAAHYEPESVQGS